MRKTSKGHTITDALRNHCNRSILNEQFTQIELAEKAGINQPTLSTFLHGVRLREPGLSLLAKALGLYGVKFSRDGVELTFKT